MFNKIYVFIKENRKEILFFLFLIVVFNIRFPYFIDSPGGTLSLKKRFQIENSNSINGDISLVYVAERPATIPTLVFSLFMKDWDIIKKEEVVASNESDYDANERGRISLNQSINNAIVYAFKKANQKIEILESKIYVTYILSDAQTDLKIGDQILSVDDKNINSKNDIAEIINLYQANDKIKIKILRNNKEIERYAYIKNYDGNLKIGIITETIYDYKTDLKINYDKNSSELGSSGGFINTLYFYASLVSEDIIKGRNIVGTGTIDENGNIGAIGGLKYKMISATKYNADIFFVPSDNCEEAKSIKKEKKLNLKIACVANFDEALKYLSSN